MSQSAASNRASTRMAIRLIPIFILCAFVIATYIYVGHICVQYYIRDKGRTAFGTGMIVLYFILFFLTQAAYLRTFATVVRDPGFVPLVNGQEDNNNNNSSSEKQPIPPPPPPRRRRRRRGQDPDIEAEPWTPPDMNPDSPGLEQFYSKDVFVCEADGRPKWCSGCRQWKPDRAHHSSELRRCVRKMDHLCPWVGGMVSETSFNFFAQFTFYCALYCSVTLAVTGYTLNQQSKERESPDGWVVAGLVLSAFFLLFSAGMALTSLRYILTNMTNIDMFSRSRISYMAVRIPLETPPSSHYPTIVYPLQQPKVLPEPANPTADAPPPPVAVVSAGPGLLLQADNSNRDQWAQHKFAILRLDSRENPWDLGFARNWTSVMGHNPLEWLFPIKHSPCCDHERMEGDYPTGPLLDEVKRRFNFPGFESAAAAAVAVASTQNKEHVTV